MRAQPITTAMILAAGRGERMRPLTNHCPKPLLTINGQSLLAWHLKKLAAVGIKKVVINTSYLANQIHNAIGDGHDFKLQIQYSDEQPAPLETLGGILRALPLLGQAPFLLINGDIWSDHSLSAFISQSLPSDQARLLLVGNPLHNPNGDFELTDQHCIKADPHKIKTSIKTYTYSGIGLYQASFFHNLKDTNQPQALAPWLFHQARQGLLQGELSHSAWFDIGTPERLQFVTQHIQNSQPKT